MTPLLIRQRIGDLLARAMWPLVRRASLRREHRGFSILTLIDDGHAMAELAAARIALALDLIAACDPHRFERIRRDMPNIRIVRDGGGFFVASVRACVIDWPDITWYPVVNLARTIVHEATHARLHAVGIDYPERWRRRIERRCLLEEVAFLRRLPDGGAEAAAREAAVEGDLAREWWAPHRAIERHIRGARAEQAPGWLVRLLERRQARLARQAAEATRPDAGPPS